MSLVGQTRRFDLSRSLLVFPNQRTSPVSAATSEKCEKGVHFGYNVAVYQATLKAVKDFLGVAFNIN
jgi:hypothetical protein